MEIAEDGGYAHWLDVDVHLDLEALRTYADPERRARAKEERLRHDARLGRAIRAALEAHGLTQTAFNGLTERQLRRIEKGSRPRITTLEKLAAGHGMTLDAYLDDLADGMAAAI